LKDLFGISRELAGNLRSKMETSTRFRKDGKLTKKRKKLENRKRDWKEAEIPVVATTQGQRWGLGRRSGIFKNFFRLG